MLVRYLLMLLIRQMANPLDTQATIRVHYIRDESRELIIQSGILKLMYVFAICTNECVLLGQKCFGVIIFI